jgi:Cyclophilin-like family
MNDLFGREKFGHLPRAISESGERTHTYEVGQIVYWSPGPDVAIFYRNDRQDQTIEMPYHLNLALDKGSNLANFLRSLRISPSTPAGRMQRLRLLLRKKLSRSAA